MFSVGWQCAAHYAFCRSAAQGDVLFLCFSLALFSCPQQKNVVFLTGLVGASAVLPGWSSQALESKPWLAARWKGLEQLGAHMSRYFSPAVLIAAALAPIRQHLATWPAQGVFTFNVGRRHSFARIAAGIPSRISWKKSPSPQAILHIGLYALACACIHARKAPFARNILNHVTSSWCPRENTKRL